MDDFLSVSEAQLAAVPAKNIKLVSNMLAWHGSRSYGFLLLELFNS